MKVEILEEWSLYQLYIDLAGQVIENKVKLGDQPNPLLIKALRIYEQGRTPTVSDLKSEENTCVSVPSLI